MTKQIEQRKIEYGSKILEVNVNINDRIAEIRFGTASGLLSFLLHRRKNHETTIAFHQAEEEIRKIASALHQPITLTFDTANDNLKNWVIANQEELEIEIEPTENKEPFRLNVKKKIE